MPNGYQQVPEKKSSEMEKPSEKPLTLDHESDIMNMKREEGKPHKPERNYHYEESHLRSHLHRSVLRRI